MAFTEFYCDASNVGGVASNLNGGSSPSGTAPTFSSTVGTWDGISVYTTAVSTANVTVGQFASVYTGTPTSTGYIAKVASITTTSITLTTTVSACGTAPSAGTASMIVGGPLWKTLNDNIEAILTGLRVSLTDLKEFVGTIRYKSGNLLGEIFLQELLVGSKV